MLSPWHCIDHSAMAAAFPLVLRSPGLGYQLLPSLAGKTDTPKPTSMVAVLSLQGLMTRYGVDRRNGNVAGTSTVALRSLIDSIRRDGRYRAAVVRVDSGGGTSDGTVELFDAFAALAATMPVTAAVDGYCCSAALMAVAGVTQIVASRGSVIGGIGTTAVIVDSSALMEKIGIQVIAITTAEAKTIGVPGLKVSEYQKSYLARLVSAGQANFDAALRAGRKLTAAQMAMVTNGEIWQAPRAKQLGLVDGIATIDEVLHGIETPIGMTRVVAQMQEVEPSSPPPREIVRRVPVGGMSIHVNA